MTLRTILLISTFLLPLSIGASESDPEATEVDTVDVKFEKKQSEIKTLDTEINAQKRALGDLKKEQEKREKNAANLEKARKQAQSALQNKVNRVVNDPSLTINNEYDEYKRRWQDVQDNQSDIASRNQQLSEQQQQIEQKVEQKQKLVADLENLAELRNAARIKRIKSELTYTDDIKVTHAISCSDSMTLGECSNQGKTLTMQKAVSSFKDKLLDNVTESEIAKQNADKVTFNIHVLNSNIIESSFSGANRYSTTLEAQMKSSANREAGCKLLNLSNRYCVEKTFKQKNVGKKRTADSKPKKWVNVTIRSNHYEDTVTIDGVKYGSTPVDVMLPAGKHQLTVQKDGLVPYSNQIILSKDVTIKAQLRTPKKNTPKPGKKFADVLKNKKSGPDMVVIPSGEYSVGKNGGNTTFISATYAISATPITVKQFSLFVSKTGYLSAAEKGQGCYSLQNGESTQSLTSNWRKPGFRQKDTSPAVCLTKSDATAYSEWLSKQTGFKYDLPTGMQWEVAARAGTKTNYWWGDNIGVAQANAGWSGSIWSNKSTSPVASFGANAFGLYDTAGNVWEWTHDSKSYVRGGAWSFAPNQSRVFERLEMDADKASNHTGFRVIRKL